MGRKILKIFLIIVVIILMVLGAIVGAGYYYINNKISKINYVEIEEEKIGINEEVKLTGYRNIALFGVDSRDDSYGKGTRSDCIIIIAVNQETDDVKLVSVYRDTYVEIEGYGLDKITHAYSYGGVELALNTLNRHMDLNISEFVVVNFEVVIDTINALGGIDMEVTAEEINYLNGYLNEIDAVQGLKTERVKEAGKQNLNGAQALAYSRIRYTEGGDYRRTERMRDVITAALEKAKTLSIGKINNIVNIILPKVYTNIEANEIITLLPQVFKYNIGLSIGWPYEVKGVTLNRWYGVPVTLESNVTKLHQEIFGEMDYVPSQTVQDINAKIVKKVGNK